MSRLDKLIAELCPNGVTYKTLDECCILEKGKTAIQKAIPGDYPLVVTAAERKTANEYQFEKPTVCVPLVSSRGHGVASLNAVYYQEGKFALGNILCGVSPLEESGLNAKFLYYYLNLKKDTLIVPLMKGGANVSLTVNALKTVKMPIPPMEVQNEIIRIIDKFGELIEALNEELTIRKTQYEYYRDILISNVNGKPGKLLDMLERNITDGPHTTPTLFDSGVPFVSATAVYDGRVHLEDMKGYISKEFDEECAKKYKPQKHDVFMVKSGSTTGKVAYVDFDDDFNVWSPIAAMRTNSLSSSRFLYHLLQTTDIQNQVKERMSHGSQPNLSMRALEQFDVVIPDLREQERLSKILDRMGELTYGVESGLPAEIEIRKKQLEYYKDRILEFKEAD